MNGCPIRDSDYRIACQQEDFIKSHRGIILAAKYVDMRSLGGSLRSRKISERSNREVVRE